MTFTFALNVILFGKSYVVISNKVQVNFENVDFTNNKHANNNLTLE